MPQNDKNGILKVVVGGFRWFQVVSGGFGGSGGWRWS